MVSGDGMYLGQRLSDAEVEVQTVIVVRTTNEVASEMTLISLRSAE
jgi:hypothetical protein